MSDEDKVPKILLFQMQNAAIDLAKQLGEAEAAHKRLRDLVAEQANDPGLWFDAATAPEAYLQAELRRLHAAVEGAP